MVSEREEDRDMQGQERVDRHTFKVGIRNACGHIDGSKTVEMNMKKAQNGKHKSNVGSVRFLSGTRRNTAAHEMEEERQRKK